MRHYTPPFTIELVDTQTATGNFQRFYIVKDSFGFVMRDSIGHKFRTQSSAHAFATTEAARFYDAQKVTP